MNFEELKSLKNQLTDSISKASDRKAYAEMLRPAIENLDKEITYIEHERSKPKKHFISITPPGYYGCIAETELQIRNDYTLIIQILPDRN